MTESDPLRERLRAADPARSIAPPPETWIAELTEAVMAHDTDTRPAAPSRRPAWLVPAGVAASVIVAAGLFLVVGTGSDGQPSAGPEPTVAASTPPSAAPASALALRAGATQAGRCLPVSTQTLSTFPIAVDATVESIDLGNAGLTVNRWWAGGTEAQRSVGEIEVQGMSRELQELVAGVDLRRGGRYLITASAGGDVTACGLSAAYSPRLERLYAAAFGG